MSFQGPNDPGIADSRDRSSLQPADWADRAPGVAVKRDSRMDWVPDLVNDATEWIQRAGMGDEEAIKEVCLSVAPALLAEVRRGRAAS
jgi:hypothetical protein